MKKTVIKNYVVEEKTQTKINLPTKIPKIVKKINVGDETKIEIPGETIPTKNEPIITSNKNQDGIITSIDVVCSCGEKITIKLEY